MSAKKHLQQIEKFNCCIEHKKQLLKELSSKILSIPSFQYSEDKVSGGGIGSGFAEDVIKKIELENEINVDIIKLEYLKNDITNQIHQLDNPIHINILFKRYVELKTFNKISQEINYSFKQPCRLHKKALSEFEKNVLECPIAYDVK